MKKNGQFTLQGTKKFLASEPVRPIAQIQTERL
jgi:hypothetical protein